MEQAKDNIIASKAKRHIKIWFRWVIKDIKARRVIKENKEIICIDIV